MLVATLPALDPSALLQFALAALLILFGAVLVVKRAASRYFVVDASFEGYEAPPRRAMSIGGGAREADGACATCGKPGSKKCSRCKRVRYCSQVCQSKHWNADHKFNCKQPKTPDEVEIVSSGNGPCKKRKSSGFSSVSLVPARETCDVLREPKKILFPYDEFVELFNWGNPGFRPCGLVNCGNSCYANVVLQCLASTRPLVAYLLERDHSKNCIRKQEDWCFLCELQIHVQRASKSMNPFSPLNILSRLPNIGGNLGCGRQEDAHEFMRFAIDTMQSVCLDEHGGEKALDPSIQETTLIQYIFGGYLQSQVACTECNMISNRYENMMDLTVEIQGDAESIEKCLEQFTKKEWLDGENKYKCDGCNAYVKAWKRLTVHQPPNILTIALKRFQSGRFGKLNKRVTFPENLDLSPYMSGCSDGTEIYTLYAVVVHVDMLNASFFGHYVCYTKDFYGQWYRVDDCKVMKVEVEDVLSEGAYMLLYSRKSARRHPFTKPVKHSSINQLNEANSKVSSSIKIADAVSDSSLPCEKDAQVNPDELLVFNNDKENESVFSTFVNSPKVEDLTDMDVATPIIESEIPVQKALVDMDLDDPSLNSSVAKDSLGSPSISSCLNETTSGMANLLLDMPVISSVEVHTEKVQESSTSYDGDNGLGESGGSSKNEKSSYGSLPMADDSITNCGSSVLVPDTSLRNENKHQKPGSLDDPMHKSEYSEGTCSVSDSTIGGGTHIGNKATEALPSCSKNGTRRDSSEIFSRGFLNKPARKKSLNSARKVDVGSHLVNNHLKENGFSNGHPKLVLENQVSSLDDGKDVCPDDMSLISHGVLQNPPLKASDNDSDISHCVPQNPPLKASDNKSRKEPNILEHSFGNHSNGSVTYTCNPLSENANTGLLTACYNGSTSGKDVS